MSFHMNKKIDYGLVALSSLITQREGANEPMSARQIADKYNLPLPLLMKVLKELNHAGIVESRRGTTGGYLLSRDPSDISLLEVVEALDGPVNLTDCCPEESEKSASCSLINNCPNTGPLRGLNNQLSNMLTGIMLTDLYAGTEF